MESIIAIAKLKYLRIAPRKVRLIVRNLNGLSVNEAEAQLLFNKKRASQPLLKLLRSAMANAKNKGHTDIDRLYISSIRVDQGPVLKRWLPRAMGRVTPLQKKSSHIYLELKELSKAKPPKYRLPEKPKKPKKTKEERIKKEKEDKKKPEKKKEEAKTFKLEKKPPAERFGGFVRKIFRRKVI